MGTKLGQFRTYDNDLITVIFTGDNIVDGDLTLATSPVILQMDGGGREYTPIKYTTASITCITTGTELFDLFVQEPLGVAVEIRNSTAGRSLFAGYVTPNTFSQPIDGNCDSIAIECVDWLGIAKYVPYVRMRNDYLCTITVREAVMHIASLLSPDANLVAANFVQLGISGRFTRHYPELVLSEGYFFSDPTQPDLEDDDTLSLSQKSLTCYDALALLSESFRATWVQLGKDIILCDTLSVQADGAQQFYALGNSAVSDELTNIGDSVAITADSFAAMGNTMSALRRYTLFTLARTRKEYNLLPDIFAKDYLYAVGDRVTDNIAGDGTSTAEVSFVQRLKSRMVTFSNAYSDNLPDPEATSPMTFHPSASFIGQNTVSTAIPVDYTAPELLINWDDSWNNMLRIYKPGVFISSYPVIDTTNFVRVNIARQFSMPIVECQYLSLQIDIEAGVYAPATENDIRWYAEPNRDISNILVSTLIRCGESYYDIENGEWTDNPVWGNLNIIGLDKSWKETTISTKGLPKNVIASDTRNGDVQVSFRFFSNATSSDKRPTIIFFKKINVHLTPSHVALDNAYRFPLVEPQRRRIGDTRDEYGSVELPITFGYPASSSIFSSTIEGVQYVVKQSLGGNPEIFLLSGEMSFFNQRDGQYTTLDRIERLATFGDGREFNLNIKDPHNALSPLDAFTSPLWQGNKVMMGFLRDIERNTINVILD